MKIAILKVRSSRTAQENHTEIDCGALWSLFSKRKSPISIKLKVKLETWVWSRKKVQKKNFWTWCLFNDIFHPKVETWIYQFRTHTTHCPELPTWLFSRVTDTRDEKYRIEIERENHNNLRISFFYSNNISASKLYNVINKKYNRWHVNPYWFY